MEQRDFHNKTPLYDGAVGSSKKKKREALGNIKPWHLLSSRQKNRCTERGRGAIPEMLFQGAMGKATDAYLNSTDGQAVLDDIILKSAFLGDIVQGLTVDVNDAMLKKDQSSTSDRKHVILTTDQATADGLGTGNMASVGNVRLHAIKLFRRRMDETVKKVFGLTVISDELIPGSRVVLNLKKVLEVVAPSSRHLPFYYFNFGC